MGEPQIIRTPGGEELVVMPRAEYDALVAAAEEAEEDAADLAIARERFADWNASGRLVTPPEVAVLILKGHHILGAFRRYRNLTETELGARAGVDPAEIRRIETREAAMAPPCCRGARCGARYRLDLAFVGCAESVETSAHRRGVAMIRFLALSIAVACLAETSPAVAAEPAKTEPAKTQTAATRETILFIRHGEKQPTGFGQLSCKGLNRALALPAVLKARYGKIDVVFAPDPSHQKPDGPLSYDYVRPLATIEPAAIRFGLPVHAAIGYEETAKLRAALLLPEFYNATVLVAWEHHALDALVPALVGQQGGNSEAVPDWPRQDFDSIWRVTIERSAAGTKVTFAHEHQNLDGQSDTCPNVASPPLETGVPSMLEQKQNKWAK